MKQPKYIKDHDKKYGTKNGLPKVKQKKLKKGYVYNTGKGLKLNSGNKSQDAYWNNTNYVNTRTKY